MPFCYGLVNIPWEVFSEKLLPRILKMADLTNTLISRRAASEIIRAGSLVAAKKGILTGGLLQAYLELCQDADTCVTKETLAHLKTLLHDVTEESANADFFPEVLLVIDE